MSGMQLGLVKIWQLWERSLFTNIQTRIKIMKLTKTEGTPKIQYGSFEHDMCKLYADGIKSKYNSLNGTVK